MAQAFAAIAAAPVVILGLPALILVLRDKLPVLALVLAVLGALLPLGFFGSMILG